MSDSILYILVCFFLVVLIYEFYLVQYSDIDPESIVLFNEFYDRFMCNH